MSTEKISFLLNDGFALILTRNLNVSSHSHSALQITLSAKGHSLCCDISSQGIVKNELIVVPPLQEHMFIGDSGPVLILLIDEGSVVSQSLTESRPEFEDIEDLLNLQKYLNGKMNILEIHNAFIQTNFYKKLVKTNLDERISVLKEKIKIDENFLPSASEAAQLCHLSESRFLHLFKEELGLPFRKYLQWIKLRRSINYIVKGHSLTEAAHAGGFSDSAHLSRYFKESFGISPSEVL